MERNFILGIDAGTSVIKAALFDRDGNEVSRGARNVPIHNPTPQEAEEDMFDVWEAATTAIQEALTGSGVSPDEILAVGLTGQGDGSWMINKDGEPVGPAILWTDGRAGDIVEAWMADGSTTKQFSLTGNGPYAGTASAILKWRLENQPELMVEGNVHLWCKDWIGFKLTGVAKGDPSDASLMGIDMASRTYSDEAMEILGITDAKVVLPELLHPHEQLGEITDQAAGVTGLPKGLPVFKGSVDISASSLGVGVAKPGDCMAVVGTAGIVTVAGTDPVNETAPEDVGWMIPHTPETWIRSMGLSFCTPNLDWYLRELGGSFRREAEARTQGNLYEYLDQVVEQTPIGSNGLIFHGYLAPGGERAPFTKPDARGMFNGINNSHTRNDMLRAVYEGVALGIRDCLDAIPTEVNVVRMAGGGANSPVWAQIFADVLGRTIEVPAGTEFGAKGAAIAAAVGVGRYASYAEGAEHMVHVRRTYTPNAENTAKYDKFFGVYKRIRLAMLDIWDDLADAVDYANAN